MPLIDDPSTAQSLLTPRGFIDLPDSNELTAPGAAKVPEEPEAMLPTWAPSHAEMAISGAVSLVNPLAGLGLLASTNPTVQSAFRVDNTIGSTISRIQDTFGVSNDFTDSGYNPWDDVKGTPYEQYWKSTFAYSNNPGYTAALKSSIDRQEEDRRIVDASGFTGLVSGILAGTLDPTVLIPVGGEVTLVGKGVWRVSRGLAAGARAGGIGVALQEAGLQASQETRTLGESAFNVGTGIVLGAVIGGGLSALLSPPQRVGAEAALENLVNVPVPGSAGAAAPHYFTFDDLKVQGTLTRNIANALPFSPNLRGLFRESPVAVRTYQELATNTLRLQMHTEGLSLGPSVEDHIRVSLGETVGQALEKHPVIYKDGKKAGFGMSAQGFDEAVGRAMRRGDIGENDFVSKAAAMWRATNIEPLKEQAIKLGLLPEDVSVTEADSYFSRMYNTEKVVAQKPQFIAITKEHYNGILNEQYGKDVEKLKTKQGVLDEELGHLSLSPEERVAKLSNLEKDQEGLETLFPEAASINDRIKGLRAEAAKAKKAGDSAGEANAKAQVEALKAQGGSPFLDFKKAEAAIKKARRQIGLGYAGMLDKADAIHQQLADLSQNNFKALGRLVKRGQQLAKELQKLDPEKAREKVSGLKGDFYLLVTRSEQAQDRLAQKIERLNKDTDKRVEEAKASAGLNKEKLNVKEQKKAASIEKKVRAEDTKVEEALSKALEAEKARTAKLSAISDRLQAAEAVDSVGDIADVRAAVDTMTLEMSNASLGRGEKATALLERLSKLDPAKVDEHVTRVTDLKKSLDRKFLNKWEIRRLGEDVDPYSDSVPDFSTHAEDLAHETYDAITGNDYGSASVDPYLHLAAKTGPLKERTFHIPDAKIEDFLEDNVVKVMNRFSRQMSSQLAIEKVFPGDPLLKGRFEEIKNEYDALITHAPDEKTRLALEKDKKNAFTDLNAFIEIHRGSYMARENASSFGRLVRGLMNFNYIRSMGGAAIPSLGDVLGPAIFHGFGRFMTKGVPALLKTMDKEALAGLIAEGKYAGVAERLSHHRLLTTAEVGDPYAKGNAFERLLDNGTHVASKWNGLTWLTDYQKQYASIVVQDRMNGALLRGTDDPFLAYSGMNQVTRGRVADQLRRFGDEIDGITIANTHEWTDEDAVRAYRIAINRNVNADIVSRGVGDIPLRLYSPGWRMLSQFKTFSLAAHQRTLLRAMQLGPAQFFSGLIATTSMGMFAATLSALRGGEANWEKFKNSTKNPAFLVAEGIDRAGFFTVPLDISNVIEKATAPSGYAINPVKTPLLLAGKMFVPDASMQGNSQKYAGQGAVSAIGGPTLGLPEDIARAVGGAVNATRTDKEASAAQKNAVTRIVPFGSYLGMKEMLQFLTDNSPYSDHPEDE